MMAMLCFYKGHEVLEVLDNDTKKHNTVFCRNIMIKSPHLLEPTVPVLVCLNDKKAAEAVSLQCRNLGYTDVKVYSWKDAEEELKAIPDQEYLEYLWEIKMGNRLDWKHPVTFNEKLQWLKLFDQKPIHTTMVDKYEVKDHVRSLIGEEHVIDAIGVWDRYEDIDFDSLPEQFVLKCTHDSGNVVVCRDKKQFDPNKHKDRFRKALEKNYYYRYREWPYKNVRPRLLVEKYVEDEYAEALVVYKFICFHGEPKIIQVIQDDKHENESIDYFDADWTLLDIKQNFPNSARHLTKPKSFERMKEMARTLSADEILVRVDFYEVKGEPFFSEFTFYSDAGFEPFSPPEWDEILGSWINLPAGTEC